MEHILKEIKDAEQKAKDIAARADKEKENIIQDAIQRSAALFEQRKLELENKSKAELEKKRKELEEEKAAAVGKAKKEAELLEKNAKKNSHNAVEHVLEKFEESIKYV